MLVERRRQRRSRAKGKKGEKKAETAAAAEATSNVDKIFAFTCTSDYVEVANALNIPKS